jgi:hypothetical protein
MGFRMRKSIKVAPGVRVNVSKRGVGASVGGRGARYSVHSSGQRTVSAGSGVIPGVYYQKSVSGKALVAVPALVLRNSHPSPRRSLASSRRRERNGSTRQFRRRTHRRSSRWVPIIRISACPRTAWPA